MEITFINNFLYHVLKISLIKIGVKKKHAWAVTPQLRGMNSADPPEMSLKILSSGFSNIFMGKGDDHYHQ